ncbi:hypothetical protein [Agromyces subbeticus]|uniref:hypothetical protein n=1 Tax=Agromyces subbeticus TaxID=293890 RepID=UPI0012EB366F|nr:hypothetical protein [Agromyces subbeticus]
MKRATLTDRVIAIAIGVALLLGIGTGAAFAFGVLPPLAPPPVATSAATPTPTPTPTPTATPTPTPTPPPAPVVEAGPPPSRYGLECGSLVAESMAADLFNTEVGSVDPIVSASGVGVAIPRPTSVLSLGGTLCGWSNGVPYNPQYGSRPEYAGVTVLIVPRPAEGWTQKAVAYGMPRDESGCRETACTASAAVGDAWVEVEAIFWEPNSMNPSAWQPFVDSIIEAMSAIDSATELVVPERASSPFPLDCDAAIPLGTVQSLTATPDADWGDYTGSSGGWSLWAEARVHADNVGCRWGSAQSDGTVAGLAGIENGRWAYERMVQAGTSVPVELAGLRPEDEASIRCAPEFSRCAVDLRIGPDWFNIDAKDEATAIALAEAALAQLSP